MNRTAQRTSLDLAGIGIPDPAAAVIYGHLLRASLGPHAPILVLHGAGAHDTAAALMAGYHQPASLDLDHATPDQLCAALTTPRDTPVWLHTTDGEHLPDIAAFTHTAATNTVLATATTLRRYRPAAGILALPTRDWPRPHTAPAGYWPWLLHGYRAWITTQPGPAAGHAWLATLSGPTHPVIAGALPGWHGLTDYQLATGVIDPAGWHHQLHTVRHATDQKASRQ